MGKKRCRKSYKSRGERKNCASMPSHWDALDKAIFKARAKAKKKRVCETIPNPDKTNTKERFIRICTNG